MNENHLSINFITPKNSRSKHIVYIFWNDYFYKKQKYDYDFEYSNDLMYMSSMLSNSMLYHNYNRILCHDIEQALEIAKSAGFVHAFIQTPGNVVRKNINSALLDFVNNNNYFLAGHILDGKPKNRYLWMHEQCFLFNLTHLDNFDYTIDTECNTLKVFQNYERSPDNFHDDYTPLWVKGVQSQTKTMSYDWSASWLNYGLSIDSIKVFPDTIRSVKFHMYPENPGHRETWKRKSTSNNQLSKILQEYCKPDAHQHVFNNENFSNNVAQGVKDTIDTLVVPASGFFAVHAAKFFKPTKIIFYDIDDKTLNFRKAINESWDGKSPLNNLIVDDLTPFSDLDVTKIPLIEGNWFKNQEEVDKFWPIYKSIKKEYVKIDIIEDYDKFVKLIPNNGNVFIWLNSIYTYSINVWNHRPKKIFEAYFGLVYGLKAYSNRLWIHCKEPTGQYRSYEVHDYSPDAVSFAYSSYREYL